MSGAEPLPHDFAPDLTDLLNSGGDLVERLRTAGLIVTGLADLGRRLEIAQVDTDDMLWTSYTRDAVFAALGLAGETLDRVAQRLESLAARGKLGP